jgi:AI-2 transport protein TqsA
MNGRFQSLVAGAVLAAIIGWVLHIGKEIFVPIVLGAFLVYVIAGVTRLLRSLPFLGRILPQRVHSALSVLVIAFGLVAVGHLILANKDSVLALAPQYQESLLAAIQKTAVFFRIEAEPTWTTLRRDLMGQVNIQSLIGSMVASVSSIAVTVVVVILYASFLLIEKRSFDTKIAAISSDPRSIARIRQITSDIDRTSGV